MDKLIDYIKSHGIEAHALNGALMALDVWTTRDETGRVVTDQAWVEVESTVKAVRDWLGY